jgi:NitT/TauT family transport system permease protein
MKHERERGKIPAPLAAVIRFLQAVLILAVCWKLLSLIVGQRLFPAPERVLPLFLKLFPREISFHLASSALRCLAAMGLASAAGFPLGILLGRSRVLDSVLSPAAYLLYPLPKIAFLPVLLLVFGLNDRAKIALLFLVIFFQVLVSVRDGVKSVDPGYFRVARAMGLGRLATLRYVTLPAALPALLSSQRLAAGTAVSVLFFSESVNASSGLGYFVMDAWMRLDYPRMFSGILALGLLGLALFAAIDGAERLLCRWKA